MASCKSVAGAVEGRPAEAVTGQHIIRYSYALRRSSGRQCGPRGDPERIFGDATRMFDPENSSSISLWYQQTPAALICDPLRGISAKSHDPSYNVPDATLHMSADQ